MSDKIALKVSGIDVFYRDFHALWDVSVEVPTGQIVSVIGTNGSGKSTLLKAIAGLMAPAKGNIEVFGENTNRLSAYQKVDIGLSLVPEGRRVFTRMTVFENLLMGSYTPTSRAKRARTLERVYELFPRLQERRNQKADTLSGGEQQMLALGRALMSEPKILLCDEISLGLAPTIINDIYRRLKQINAEGITVMLVEQDITRSLKAANYAYVMLEGKVALQGNPADLTEDKVKKAYFGI